MTLEKWSATCQIRLIELVVNMTDFLQIYWWTWWQTWGMPEMSLSCRDGEIKPQASFCSTLLCTAIKAVVISELMMTSLRPSVLSSSTTHRFWGPQHNTDVVEDLLECCIINDHSQEDLFTRIVLVHHRLILDFYDMINIFPWNNHKKTVKWRPTITFWTILWWNKDSLCSFFTFGDGCYFVKKVWWQNFERGSCKVGWHGSLGTACWHCTLSFPPYWRISYKSEMYFSPFSTLLHKVSICICKLLWKSIISFTAEWTLSF